MLKKMLITSVIALQSVSFCFAQATPTPPAPTENPHKAYDIKDHSRKGVLFPRHLYFRVNARKLICPSFNRPKPYIKARILTYIYTRHINSQRLNQ